MPESPLRCERNDPPAFLARLRPLLQREPATPGPGAGHSTTAGPLTRWLDPHSARARWASPRLRARSVTTAEVLPVHNPSRVHLDEEKHVQRSQPNGLDDEEIAGEHAARVGAEKGAPG